MNNMGEYTFQEAYDRTGRIINITAAPTNNYDPPRLLNYLTAPHVCVWSAALASCAIPGMFDAVPLIVREPNGEFRVESNWCKFEILIIYYNTCNIVTVLVLPIYMLQYVYTTNYNYLTMTTFIYVIYIQYVATIIQPPTKNSPLSRTMSLGGFSFYDKKDTVPTKPKVKVTKVYDEIDVVKYTDGSIESDLPMVRLSELFNVNHFIVYILFSISFKFFNC